jgi:hypothetical protein
MLATSISESSGLVSLISLEKITQLAEPTGNINPSCKEELVFWLGLPALPL